MQADTKRALRLLKTAKGQVDGLIRMVEEDRYCIDIAHQLMATAALLRRLNRDILKAHLEHCVKASLEGGDAEEKVKEFADILALLSG